MKPIQNTDTAKIGADSVFEYIERTAEVVPDGIRWKTLSYENKPQYAISASTGVSGISLFLSDYYRLYRRPKTKEKAECQWCHGSAGIGLFYTKAYEVMGEESCLKTAKAAGENTFAYGDFRNSPIQCHGLSGNAELFIELYRLTQDNLWLERAHDFATRIFSYRITSPEGDAWQIDEPGLYSPDFLCGAAGIGHFYLRLGASDQLRMPLG
jgi:lantibiotic modifying enzyme